MLKRILSLFLKPLYFYITSQKYRELANLKFKYGGVGSYHERELKFRDYKLKVPDVPSFLDQYEAIFYKHSYKYESATSNPVIYDCGANIGMAALYFSTQYPSSSIKSFEPDPEIVVILKENLKKNNIKNVEVIEKAVWINNEGVFFQHEGGQGGRIRENALEKNPVSSIRLRDLLSKESSIDMLKIDIEGAELAVIKDCTDQLFKVKQLFVEYHFISIEKSRLSELLEILENNQFSYYIQNSPTKQPFLYKTQKEMFYTVEIFANRI